MFPLYSNSNILGAIIYYLKNKNVPLFHKLKLFLFFLAFFVFFIWNKETKQVTLQCQNNKNVAKTQ